MIIPLAIIWHYYTYVFVRVNYAWRSWSFICKGGWYGLFLLLGITILSALFGWNFASHLSDQRCIWLRSWFRRKSVSLGLSTMRYKLVLSVNSLISALISFTISFIKIINKRVPSIELWGTPTLIGNQLLEFDPLITTLYHYLRLCQNRLLYWLVD